MHSPSTVYQGRARHLLRLITRLTKTHHLFLALKALLLVPGLGGAFLFLSGRSFPIGGGALFFAIFFFIFLDGRHAKQLRHQKYATILLELNEKAIKRINDEWNFFADTGEEYRDESHPFAGDLDLFGRGSLFQKMNTTSTFLGRKTLVRFLREPLCSVAEIKKRQEAVREAAPKVGWRQRLQAEGVILAEKLRDPEPLCRWAGKVNEFFCRFPVKLFIRVLPAITLTLLVLAFFTPKVPFYLPGTGLMIQFLLLLPGRKERTRVLNTVYLYRHYLNMLDRTLRLFESRSFRAMWLRERQERLKDRKDETAWAQVARLDRIADAVANRYNMFYFFLNILTLWDYQCLIALETWKQESGRRMGLWMETIAEVEALMSLAGFRYDNPDWVFPDVADQSSGYTATGLGHPLLPKTRVYNNLTLQAPVRVHLITGSNMSGKSTWLRTVGINLLLAYIGAPVCASSLRCAPMELFTCMRISDNLEKSISTFYAEILRIKEIVAATGKDRPVFFLLDEIFKGTNSVDRHTGAAILIKKLIGAGATGLVSTHDLELGQLEQETGGKVRNFHFQEFYRENELEFDYKLRPGLATTRNARFLMKMAGIEE